MNLSSIHRRKILKPARPRHRQPISTASPDPMSSPPLMDTPQSPTSTQHTYSSPHPPASPNSPLQFLPSSPLPPLPSACSSPTLLVHSSEPATYTSLPHEIRLEIARHIPHFRDFLAYRHVNPINMRLTSMESLLYRYQPAHRSYCRQKFVENRGNDIEDQSPFTTLLAEACGVTVPRYASYFYREEPHYLTTKHLKPGDEGYQWGYLVWLRNVYELIEKMAAKLEDPTFEYQPDLSPENLRVLALCELDTNTTIPELIDALQVLLRDINANIEVDPDCRACFEGPCADSKIFRFHRVPPGPKENMMDWIARAILQLQVYYEACPEGGTNRSNHFLVACCLKPYANMKAATTVTTVDGRPHMHEYIDYSFWFYLQSDLMAYQDWVKKMRYFRVLFDGAYLGTAADEEADSRLHQDMYEDWF